MFVEVIVVIGIMALVAAAMTMSVFQMTTGTEQSSSYITAVRQVQNAGYWISHDGQMAESVDTDNLTPPAFLILKWTDWGYDSDSIYHSVVYSVENVFEGVGKLRRTHEDSEGTSEETLVAEHIYYNPGDPGNTTKASCDGCVLTAKIVAMFGDVEETREYKIYPRPEF